MKNFLLLRNFGQQIRRFNRERVRKFRDDLEMRWVWQEWKTEEKEKMYTRGYVRAVVCWDFWKRSSGEEGENASKQRGRRKGGNSVIHPMIYLSTHAYVYIYYSDGAIGGIKTNWLNCTRSGSDSKNQGTRRTTNSQPETMPQVLVSTIPSSRGHQKGKPFFRYLSPQTPYLSMYGHARIYALEADEKKLQRERRRSRRRQDKKKKKKRRRGR